MVLLRFGFVLNPPTSFIFPVSSSFAIAVINDVVSAAVANASPVYNAYWVGAGITVASFLAMIYVYYLDLSAEQRLRKNQGKPALKGEGLLQKIGSTFCGCCSKRGPKGSAHLADVDEEGADVTEPTAPTEEIHMGAVLKFPATFWILTLSCVTVYIDVLVYNNNSCEFEIQAGKRLNGSFISP